MDETKTVKDSIAELVDNLGTIGLFMLGEVRSFTRKSWGASREEFMDAVDQAAKSLKQSGKLAAEDIERASNQIKENWKSLDKQGDIEWESFIGDMKDRLKSIGDISQESFDMAVEHAKKTLDRNWTATGRLGEEQLKGFTKHTDNMAKAMMGQWSVFRDTMEKTGKKVDRAVQAAWEELKKED